MLVMCGKILNYDILNQFKVLILQALIYIDNFTLRNRLVIIAVHIYLQNLGLTVYYFLIFQDEKDYLLVNFHSLSAFVRYAE